MTKSESSYSRIVKLTTWFVVCAFACNSSSSTSPAKTESAKTESAKTGEAATTKAAVDVHVDRRIELMAILQRLARAAEYLGTPASSYVSAVDAHFGPFSNHPAVVATRELRQKYGISYDAPMWLAIQLDDKLELRGPPGDPRWSTVDIPGYLATLREFVTATGLDAFLAQHAAYFAKVEDRLRTAITKEDPGSWFDTFFGARAGTRFVVVPGLLCGTRNFGPRTDSELYQIIGITRVDFDELPTFDPLTLELVVHEMAHSYINPVFAKHHGELAAHGQRLFAQVEAPMRKQAYPNWQTMLDEQGVRAVTVLYLRQRKGPEVAKRAADGEVGRGFLWTPALADLLAEYGSSRAKYADLEAFMPRVVQFFADAQ